MATIAEQVVESWFDHVVTRESEGTARVYRSHMCAFLRWLEDRPLNKCNIEDYVTHCVKKEKYAKITVNGKIASIKSFCGWWCPRQERDNPATGVQWFARSETRPKRQRALSEAEYKAVLEAAESGIERDTVEFLGNTGLRRAEYVTVTLKCVNEDGTHFKVTGKGNKKRQVPINKTIHRLIAENVMERGMLRCVSYWKDPKCIWENFQSLARRANVPGFGPHALRHYFATKLIKRGVPLKLVSEILGHCSVLITEQTYCHLIPEDTTGVTDCLCE